jgi:hypothetical protein
MTVVEIQVLRAQSKGGEPWEGLGLHPSCSDESGRAVSSALRAVSQHRVPDVPLCCSSCQCAQIPEGDAFRPSPCSS